MHSFLTYTGTACRSDIWNTPHNRTIAAEHLSAFHGCRNQSDTMYVRLQKVGGGMGITESSNFHAVPTQQHRALYLVAFGRFSRCIILSELREKWGNTRPTSTSQPMSYIFKQNEG